MCWCFLFQAEDVIRDLVRSRGLGDVYKRQPMLRATITLASLAAFAAAQSSPCFERQFGTLLTICLLYTSDAADERSSVDLGGRRIIKNTKQQIHRTL